MDGSVTRPLVLNRVQWAAFEAAGLDMTQFVLGADRVPVSRDDEIQITRLDPVALGEGLFLGSLWFYTSRQNDRITTTVLRAKDVLAW